MSDKPILFSAPMVRALLAGTKTQTRRLIKPRGFRFFEHPVFGWRYEQSRGEAGIVGGGQLDTVAIAPYLPYATGDRLYVREHWRTYSSLDSYPPRDLTGMRVWYEADEGYKPQSRFRQGMHMPRWASRITLTVTEVRVQRLHEISDSDAVAEGTPCYVCGGPMDGSSEADCHCFHRKADATDYRSLWEVINGPGSWDANPWVAAYTFTVERTNIDQARAA